MKPVGYTMAVERSPVDGGSEWLEASLPLPAITFPFISPLVCQQTQNIFPYERLLLLKKRMHWLGHDIRWVKHEWLKKCLDISQKLSHLLFEKIQMYKSILSVFFCMHLS
jgi:hypothetical protein